MSLAPQDVESDLRLPDWSLARRVLLVRLRSIGDTVLMTPCLQALKTWRPEIQTAVILEPLSAPLLENHPLVDELIIAPPRGRAGLVGRLRRGRFDVAFNMHGGTTSTFLTAFAGARHRVGYAGYRYSRLLTARAPAPDLILGRAQVHSVEQQLALLSWAGVPWPDSGPRLSLVVSAEAATSVRARLAEGGRFAVIAPAAALESKRWRASGFAAVADHLSEKWRLASILIAGPGQEAIAREVASAARCRPKVLTGMSLKELAALLDMAALFVGNDSGPAHMAAALARPLVVVFGASDPSVWHPWTDSPHRVVQSATGEAQSTVPASRPPISAIETASVTSAIDEVMREATAAQTTVER